MLAEVAVSADGGSRRRPGRPSLSNEQLLDHALDLFLEQGFERTSIEGICQAAGMAKRTVYARYGDKETLFKAALQRAIQDWIVPIEALHAAETEDLEESLLAIGRILLANISSPAGQRLLRLTNAESGRMPEIGAFSVEQGTRPTIEYLADLFRRRIGDQFDPAFAGEAFLNLITGPSISAAWGVSVDPAALEGHTRNAVRLFMHGMLAGKPPASPHIDAALAALDEARVQLVLANAGGAP